MIDQYRYEFLAGMALGSFALIFVFSIIYNEVTSKLKINGLKKSLIKLLVLGTIFIVAGYILKMETLKLSMYLIWIIAICIFDYFQYRIKAKKIDPAEIVEGDNNNKNIAIPSERNEVSINEYKGKPVAKSNKSMISTIMIVLIILNYGLILGLAFYQNRSINNLEKQIKASDGIIKKLETQMLENNKAQQSKISLLESKVDELSIGSIKNDKLSMSVNTLDNYSLMTSEYGNFLMYIEKAEEYLTGYKLTVIFGNTMDATYLNMKFHFVFPNDGSLSQKIKIGRELNLYNYDDYKYYTHDESKAISNGSWTRMVVYIPDVTLDELKSFYVIPEISSVRLNY